MNKKQKIAEKYFLKRARLAQQELAEVVKKIKKFKVKKNNE